MYIIAPVERSTVPCNFPFFVVCFSRAAAASSAEGKMTVLPTKKKRVVSLPNSRSVRTSLHYTTKCLPICLNVTYC